MRLASIPVVSLHADIKMVKLLFCWYIRHLDEPFKIDNITNHALYIRESRRNICDLH